MSGLSVLDGPTVTAEMARDLALSQGVSVRPLLRRVHDRQSGVEDVVALPCGSTREGVCRLCAHKARVLRMHQCAEGWHRTDEFEHHDQHDDLDGARLHRDEEPLPAPPGDVGGPSRLDRLNRPGHTGSTRWDPEGESQASESTGA